MLTLVPGANWDTSCADWERRLLRGQSLIPNLPLFEEEAARALRIFKRLRLPDVIGNPTFGEACGEWFFPIVAAIFGSYNPHTNIRMIQEFFELIPKGNSKSTNGGAVMVVAMIVNRRPKAEYLLVAPTKEIADIAWTQAAGIVDQDAALKKMFHPQRHLRMLTNLKNGACLKIKAADTDVITGGKALGTMIDETHVFSKHHNAADVFIEVRGALAKRPDGFLFQTTTQSKEPPAGVFAEELKRARAVRDGLIKLPLLPVLYEMPPSLGDDAWRKRKYWAMVNPNLNRSISEEFLVNELSAADLAGKAKLALFASQHFNVEIGLALKTDSWVGAEYWEQCADPTITLDVIKERCDLIVVGIDGGGLDDLLGLAVIGRETSTGLWLLWTHAWVHPIALQRHPDIAPRLMDFVAHGDLSVIDNDEDVEAIGTLIEGLEDLGLLPFEKPAVGVDQVGIQSVVEDLVRRGISMKRVIGVPQGWKLTNAIKHAERKLHNREMLHSGSPMMNWVLGNARVEPKGSAITITKEGSGSCKIDPLMAMFDAFVAMFHNPEDQRSVFDSDELEQTDAEPAQEKAESAQDDGIDQAILSNPAHPRWEEMRRRFEERLPSFEEG